MRNTYTNLSGTSDNET